MRKAFDTVDHAVSMQALRSKKLFDEFVSLLIILYSGEKGTVNLSSEFPIQKGVRYGDTLSVILLNCILHMAFDLRRASLIQESIVIANGLPRFANVRYADDILLYNKSVDEFVSMTGGLLTR